MAIMIDRNKILDIVIENVINNSTPVKGGTDRVISFDNFIDNMTNDLVKKLTLPDIIGSVSMHIHYDLSLKAMQFNERE
jgi:hypothetical protein|tara:strand:- start:226 stop:462 length:237 start_codon:yes stop_codon:yes gene_type:complete